MIRNPLKHLRSHAQLVRLLYKYGRSDLIQQSGLRNTLPSDTDASELSHDWDLADDESESKGNAGPEDLAADLEALGPAYIKLGQLLSTRPDFLPKPYLEALTRLQDDAEAISLKEVYQVIEVDLGDQPENLFRHFENEPLATASLGQVHRAITKCGKDVVVKVQRPGVAESLMNDIEAMEEFAGIAETFEFGRKFQFKHMVQSLKRSLEKELDYEAEAQNAISLAKNLQEYPVIKIPQPLEEYTSTRVLTMEYVDCQKITSLPSGRLSNETSRELADLLFKSFLDQVLIHGSFHADPHPGNIALTKDDQIVLMDCGLVVNVNPRVQTEMVKLLMCISDGDGQGAAQIAEKCGIHGDNFSSENFRQEVERIVVDNVNQSVDEMEAGSALMSIQQAAGQNDLFLPQEFIILGRALMHLERVVSSLNPEFDPNESIRSHSMNIMREHSGKKISLTSLYHTFLESTEFVQNLPARANKVADLVANNALEVKVNAINESKFLSGLHKVANRISSGLIISAMIIAAANLMQTESSWTLFGYPAIAFLFLGGAAFAGSILVYRAIVSDRFET